MKPIGIIHLVRTEHFLPPDTHTLRNVSFSENFAYVRNG